MPPKPLADLGAGLSTKSVPNHPLPPQHGPISQSERAFTAASTFLSGVMAISATQFLGAPLKLLDPKFYEAYMAFTKQSFGVLITTMTQWWAPTVVRVSGDRSVPAQLFRRGDGGLECRFPKRLVMMANHQLYTDWLYLWWIAYTNNMHGYIYIILKESLKNIPIIGWGAQFYNFIFLKRKWEDDKASFEQHLAQLSNPKDPMWLLIFPEGTNLAKGTRAKSQEWARKRGLQDMKHQLLPRSKGLQFCLRNLKESTEWLYDCTIGYEGIPPGEFGQDIFTLRSSMFEGRPPKSVNMHFRRFRIADIPVDNDAGFDVWLRNRWREKDYLLEHFARYNRFPEDHEWLARQQKMERKEALPAKAIETQIKSNNLEEFLSIFAPLGSVLTVLFLFYGGGKPEDLLKTFGEAAQAQHIDLIRDGTQPLKLEKVDSGSDGKQALKALQALQALNGGHGAENLISASAQRNLVQQYINAIRPSAAGQITLAKDALRLSNIRPGEFPVAPRVILNPKPKPTTSKALSESPKEAPQRPGATARKTASAAPVQTSGIQAVPKKSKTVLWKPVASGAVSNVSTVKPDDSISAAGVETSARRAADAKKAAGVTRVAGAKRMATISPTTNGNPATFNSMKTQMANGGKSAMLARETTTKRAIPAVRGRADLVGVSNRGSGTTSGGGKDIAIDPVFLEKMRMDSRCRKITSPTVEKHAEGR